MKTVPMNLSERQHCCLILSEQKVGATDALTLSKIFEKIKLSRTEEITIGLRVDGGNVLWTLPDNAEEISVEFEDEEARRLRMMLGSWDKYTFRDAGWSSALIKKLEV